MVLGVSRVSMFLFVGSRAGPRGLALGWGCVAEKSYAKLVFMSTSSGSLWNVHAIHSMCRMEQDQVSWLVGLPGLLGELRTHGTQSQENPSEPGLLGAGEQLGKHVPGLDNRCNPAEITQVGVGP